jgi:hypothetical protein
LAKVQQSTEESNQPDPTKWPAAICPAKNTANFKWPMLGRELPWRQEEAEGMKEIERFDKAENKKEKGK